MSFETVALGDIASELTVGHVGSMANEYLPDGVPFLRSLNVLPYRIDTNEIRYVSPAFHKKLKKSALKPGDVVIVRTGKPGTCAVVPDWLEDANCSDLVIVRCSEAIRPRYLAYWVNSIATHHIDSSLVGAVQQHFNVGAARKMPVLLPTLPQQDSILEVLASLDDKIELNRRMNETLEEMARALFRDWFVDFGPTRRQMEGATDPTAIMGQAFPPEKAATLAPLFPATMGEDGLPEGWAARSVYDFARVVYGAPFKSKQFNTEGRGRPLARIRDLPRNAAGQFTEEVHKKEHLIQPGDIVVGMDGEFRSYLWYGVPTLMNQRVCSFVPLDARNRAFVWLAIKPLLKFFEDTAIATTVIHLGKGDIDTFSIVDAGEDVMTAFSQATDPMASKIVANGQENQTLTALRDLLLPKLMSGEIRLKDAEAVV